MSQSQFVKLAGEYGSFVDVLAGYKNAVKQQKFNTSNTSKALSLMHYKANTLDNVLILALANCKKLEYASQIYNKMLEEGTTCIITHSCMMKTAIKNNSFPTVVYAFENAWKLEQYNEITLYDMLQGAASAGDEYWLDETYRRALRLFPERKSEFDLRYEVALTKFHIVKTLEAEQMKNKPNEKLSTDILSILEQETAPIPKPAVASTDLSLSTKASSSRDVMFPPPPSKKQATNKEQEQSLQFN